MDISAVAAPAATAARRVEVENPFVIHTRVLGVLDAMPVTLSDWTLEGGNPPTEFRIFAGGANPSTKGVWNFDDDAAKSVMSRFQVMNRRVTFDYDHGALQKNPVDPSLSARSAGSCIIEMRGKELWAADVKWTPPAAQALKDGEWLYISPAFDRTKDGRPTWLINIALTNNPALFSLDELQTANALTEGANALMAREAREVLTALGVTGESNDDGTMMVVPVPVGNPSEMAMATARRAEARRAATRWSINNPAAKIVPQDAPQHPAASMPLTGTYEDPTEVGGWLGWIEPAGYLQTPGDIELDMTGAQTDEKPTSRAPAGSGKDWIAFVATDGRTLLWEEREQGGGVVGNPVIWMRDLTTLFAVPSPEALPLIVVKPPHKKHAGLKTDTASPAPLTPATATGATAASATATPAAAPASGAASQAPPIKLGGTPVSAKLGGPMDCDVVSPCPYDYCRDNAASVADAVLADPAVKAGTAPDHPAATAPLTGRYADPLTNGAGRILGWIEPATKEWICFVAMDGRAVLYTSRVKDSSEGLGRTGAGIGTPVVFQRDIATLNAKDAMISTGSVVLGAIPYHGYPEPATPPDTWDADAAVHRMRVWASHDGSGDSGTIDWTKFENGFAYAVDGGPGGHKLADFKLPHHDIAHGEIFTHRKGVFAAAQRISSADIPEKDLAAVKDHIAKHYHQWGAKAPWETQEKATMHAKLDDYAKDKGFNKTEMKARLKLALPGHMHQDAMSACSDEPKDHPDDEKMKGIMKALKAFDKLDAGDGDEPAENKNNLQKHVQASGVPASITALSIPLGLPHDAPEGDVVMRVASTLEGVARLNALTGKSTLAESIAMCRAWKDSAEEGKQATAQLKALDEASKKKDALDSIDKAEREYRLTPAKKASALDIFTREGPAALNAYLSACDVIPALVPAGGAPPAGSPPAGQGGTPPVGLTALSPKALELLRAAGELPGAPPADARPSSETPAGGAKTVVLNGKQKAWVKQMGLDPTKLDAKELMALSALDLDSAPDGE